MTDYRSDYFHARFNPECKNPKCECDDTLEWSAYIKHPFLYEFPNRFGKGYKMYEVCYPYLHNGPDFKTFKVYVDGCFKPYIERSHTPIEWQDGTKWWEIEGSDLNGCIYNDYRGDYNVIQVLVSDSGCKWWFFNEKQVWGRPVYVPELTNIIGERYVKTSEVQKQIERVKQKKLEEQRHKEYWRKKEEKKEVIQAWVLGILFVITPLYVLFFC